MKIPALHIGFDAKRAFHNTTGLGNYSRTLIADLAAYAPEAKLVLFDANAPRNAMTEQLFAYPNITMQTLGDGLGGLGKAYRRNWGMKPALLQSGISIYHGLSHELPRGIEKTGIKTVVTMHDLIYRRYPEQFSRFDRAMFDWKYKRACQIADALVCISEQTRQDVEEYYGIAPKRLTVIHQACHPQFRQPLQPEHLQLIAERQGIRQPYFLSVGSVIERKNLLRSLAAFGMLAERDKDLMFYIVGKGGSYRQKVEAYIAAQPWAKQVAFLDAARFADLPALYALSIGVLYPSLFEGFGLPILEALQVGASVITSSGGCFEEVGGQAVQYVNPLSVEEIAQAMRNCLAETPHQPTLLATRLEQAAKFHPTQLCPQWWELYEKLASA